MKEGLTLGCFSRNSAMAMALSEWRSILRASVFRLRWSRNASMGDYSREIYRVNPLINTPQQILLLMRWKRYSPYWVPSAHACCAVSLPTQQWSRRGSLQSGLYGPPSTLNCNEKGLKCKPHLYLKPARAGASLATA